MDDYIGIGSYEAPVLHFISDESNGPSFRYTSPSRHLPSADGGGGGTIVGLVAGPPSPTSMLSSSSSTALVDLNGGSSGDLVARRPPSQAATPLSSHHDTGGYKMGYFGATSYVIGNIIGSGIFITPASILRFTGSVGLSLIVWIACALIALIGSLCYIELGTSIREAGCDFAYICYVKWYAVAFSFMWVSVLMTYPATIAIIAETFGQYLVEGIRQSRDIPQNLVPVAQKLFGISLLFVVTWMNFFALGKFAARFQIAATVAKLLACTLIIVTGLWYYFVEGWDVALREPMKNSNTNAGDLLMALYGGLYAYSGWDILNYGTDNKNRNMPLALLSGIGIVSAVYFAMNIAYFAVLDVEAIKTSNAVAALFSQRTMGGFSYAIPFLIGVLLIGSINSNIFSGSRYMYAAARQGHLPCCFSCVNLNEESPRAAVFAQSALAVAISFVGDLDVLIGYVMFGFWAQRIFTLLALLIIRYRSIPVHPDAIRVPLPCIWLFLSLNIGLVLIPIVQEFEITAYGICICLVGFGLYFLFIYPSTTPSIFTWLNDWSTLITSIIFDSLPDLKSRPARPIVASESVEQLLLPIEKPVFSELLSSSANAGVGGSLTDLHSDEKNTLIRNSSTSGLRMW